MGRPAEPKPAKYFVGLLSSDIKLLDSVETDLQAALGVIDGRSEVLAWNVSKFYEKEMGCGLLRRFVSFGPLISPGDLAMVKLQTQLIEERHRSRDLGASGRRVNVDPGYLDVAKVVLASTKSAGQRIYLNSGIYGEITLVYADGTFHPLAHTYPDYRWAETLAFLTSLRLAYLEQLRQARR